MIKLNGRFKLVLLSLVSLNWASANDSHRDPGQEPSQNPDQNPVVCRGRTEFKKSETVLDANTHTRRLQIHVKVPQGCKLGYFLVQSYLPKSANVIGISPSAGISGIEGETQKIEWTEEKLTAEDEKVYQVDYRIGGRDEVNSQTTGCISEEFDPRVCSSG